MREGSSPRRRVFLSVARVERLNSALAQKKSVWGDAAPVQMRLWGDAAPALRTRLWGDAAPVLRTRFRGDTAREILVGMSRLWVDPLGSVDRLRCDRTW